MCTCVHICIHPHEYKHTNVSQMIEVVDLFLPFGEKLYQYGLNKLDMIAHNCKNPIIWEAEEDCLRFADSLCCAMSFRRAWTTTELRPSEIKNKFFTLQITKHKYYQKNKIKILWHINLFIRHHNFWIRNQFGMLTEIRFLFWSDSCWSVWILRIHD